MSERRCKEGDPQRRQQQWKETKEKGKRESRRKKRYPYQSTKPAAPIPQSSVELYEILSGGEGSSGNQNFKYTNRDEALKKMPQCMVNCTFPENDICYTPLHKAAFEENIAHCQILLNRGADMDTMNNEGDTFIDVALKWGSESFQRELAVIVRKVREKRAKKINNKKMNKKKRKAA